MAFKRPQSVKLSLRDDQQAAYRYMAARARLPVATWIKQTLDLAAAAVIPVEADSRMPDAGAQQPRQTIETP